MPNLEKTLSSPKFQKLAVYAVLGFFAIFIIIPTLFVFSAVFMNWDTVVVWVFNDPIIGDARFQFMQLTLIRSFQIAFIVTIIDIIIGLPMAVILARSDFKFKQYLDTMVDLPMVVPTSALGFSIFLFWGTSSGISGLLGLESGIFSPGPMLIMMAHVAFTYPFIVRSLKAVIEEIDRRLEYAARTLGAPTFTVFRTITLPLTLEGLIAGSILAFTRSLGETGATLIVSGVYETAPIVVVTWRKLLQIPPAAFLSMILVIISVILLTAMRVLSRRFGIPLKRIYPKPEKLLSSEYARKMRNIMTFLVFLGIVFIPAIYTISYAAAWWNGSPYTGRIEAGVYYQVFLAPDNKWEKLLSALGTSLAIATLTTIINFTLGLPMAFLLVRRKWGKVREIIDSMIDIPLAIPTSALGFSIFLFWNRTLHLFSTGFWLILLVHIVFTYPYMVRPLIAIVESIDPEIEEAARSLGASALTTFRTVTLPSIKSGILAAGIMTFTRSLSETGATIIVMGIDRTVPVLIVDWVEAQALQAASFASLILILISYVSLVIIRHITKE
ncbi:MAG: ABC transporter permease [Candidatus Asgardarchaeia archaeon]